jgi:Chitobiase/beta-hexosaminidase C-terminal domain/Regulator of chromosome condensation (RCC1) repeat
LTSGGAIAAGDNFSLALKSDGTVWGWCANCSGQLGIGNVTTPQVVPVRALITGVRAIGVAGGYVGFAARRDGTLWSCGSSTNGVTGNGANGPTYSSPVQVSNLNRTTRVSVGHSYNALALDLDGVVWAWGRDDFGQIGDGVVGASEPRTVPTKVSEASFLWKVATPVMNVDSGTYNDTKTVTITCATPSAEIHYTTNGVDPTQSDALVSGSITVDQGMTLKAKAWQGTLAPSNVGMETYVLNLLAPAASPLGGTYASDQSVSLSYTRTTGVTIRYTTDNTTVTESSPAYTSPIPISRFTVLRAATFKPGWQTVAGSATSWTYVMKVGAPVLLPGGGTYTSAQNVTISTATPGAILHYTLDGTEPTDASPTIASGGTLSVPASATLNARGFKANYDASDIVSAAYTIALGTVASPTVNPPAGTYSAAQSVTLSTSTAGAVIRYTLDGTDPSSSSPIYFGPVTVDWTSTLKARAFKADYVPSAVTTAAYTVTVANTVSPPTMSPAPGRYTTARTVTLSSATVGATIYYTLNGVDPTTSSASVASGGTVTVSGPMQLRAMAGKSGMTSSPVRRGDYSISGAISSADNHSVVLKTDGTVWAWGSNNVGQLGNGTTSTTVVKNPTQVPGLAGFVAVSCNGNSGTNGWSLAVSSGGTVWSWGLNSSGQLGDGTTTTRSSPVQVSNASMTGVVDVSAGSTHTLALTSTGAVWAWGGGLERPARHRHYREQLHTGPGSRLGRSSLDRCRRHQRRGPLVVRLEVRRHHRELGPQHERPPRGRYDEPTKLPGSGLGPLGNRRHRGGPGAHAGPQDRRRSYGDAMGLGRDGRVLRPSNDRPDADLPDGGGPQPDRSEGARCL